MAANTAELTAIRAPRGLSKAPTGITGFDEITGGGLPRGRTTLLQGGPGSGKTVLALQFLVHGAQACKEPGIFVAFEEVATRIVANAEGFGWKLPGLQPKNLYFMDAQLQPDQIQAGDFDLYGLLAALDVQVRKMKARRIVFDALDILLVLLPDAAAQRREMHRLHQWLLARQLTGLITLKADAVGQPSFEFMHFMVDCAVILGHAVVQGVSQRSLRVQKYRGSGFNENEAPFLIGNSGIEVAVAHALRCDDARASTERVSCGIPRLDTMLGGGYYRGASVLITGFSGTAKTTLSGAFVEAACRRGERTLFVSFDSDASEVIRNLASVAIRLERHVKNGRLHMVSARTIIGSAETYLARIKALAREHRARCLVIDPLFTWSESGNDRTAQSVADRLIDWTKAEGITLMCTRLLDEMSDRAEVGSPLQISTLVDTWIHLSYLVQAGERNRGLSIIKSRGTAHSNQVRELILSDTGVTLADAYTAGGEVLMGTLRWEKERAERMTKEHVDGSAKLRHVLLDAEADELDVRLKALQVQLEAKKLEKEELMRVTHSREQEVSRGRNRIGELRGADAAKPGRT